MKNIEREFGLYINSLQAYPGSPAFLLAVSGGVDSMVMADLFLKNKLTFGIAHCNFQLRGTESDNDERLVRSYAEKNNVPFYSKWFETKIHAEKNKVSIQMAARTLRYEWFDELCKANKYDYVVTAHHTDDNIETMLMNFIHGRGMEALAGIRRENKNIIRPLLFATKEEILRYAKDNNVEWREDASNSSTDYERNLLRLKIIPLLKEINPSLDRTLNQTAESLRTATLLLDKEYAKWKLENVREKQGRTEVSINAFAGNPFLPSYLYKLLSPYGFAPAVIRHLAKHGDKSGSVYLSDTHRLVFSRNSFTILEHNVNNNTGEFRIEKEDSELVTESFYLQQEIVSSGHVNHGDKTIVHLDGSLLTWPLLLRKWREGDYFYPLGMQQRKKLSDYFIDEKFSIPEKEDTWLLISGDKIVWIAGNRLDDRFKINGNTETILRITFAVHGSPRTI